MRAQKPIDELLWATIIILIIFAFGPYSDE